jgi:hypothetical protein
MTISRSIKSLIEISLISLLPALAVGAVAALVSLWILMFGGIAEAQFWTLPKWAAMAAYGLCALYCIADEIERGRGALR